MQSNEPSNLAGPSTQSSSNYQIHSGSLNQGIYDPYLRLSNTCDAFNNVFKPREIKQFQK